jgi:eukaryotic-like serine/threonine-protein kinase
MTWAQRANAGVKRDTLRQPGTESRRREAPLGRSFTFVTGGRQTLLADDFTSASAASKGRVNESSCSLPGSIIHTSMVLSSGDKLGPYEIVSPLGAGGMGEVYRARDLRLGRDVAVKILLSGFAENPLALQRFEREARAVSALTHPNVCTLFDIGSQNGTHFIVMEFLEGQTLKEVIGSQALAFSSVLKWGTQIASALEAAHGVGIIHRDIKPANIFIARQGQAKLLDFGLAKFESSAGSFEKAGDETLTVTELTMRGVPIGTIAYMSPEQAQGLPATPRSDLFSLGTVLYEMATACRAFPGISTAEIFAGILGASPIPPGRLNPAIPRAFDRVIERLLEKSPEARYSTACELVAALQTFSGVNSPSPEQYVSPSTSAAPARPQRLQSLAVLPLMDLSIVPSKDYFVDGLTEALITALARLGGVRVISRTSSMCYKNTEKRVPRIAQELNVDAVLEGSVLRSGERLRLTCRLVDSRSEDLLWSENFDRNLRDILSLHDDVTQSVASGIRTHIQEYSGSGPLPSRIVNPEAFDSYLRGRYFWNKRNEPSLRKAIECFQHALDLDPLYASAYAGLADSYFYLGYSFGRMDPNDAMPRARAAALRALELDSHLAEGYCSLALVQTIYDWDWTSAESNCQRALSLNPNMGTARHFYSLLLAALRRTEDSLAQIHAALQGDPLSLPINNFVGMMYFAARQYDQSIAASRKTLEMDPGFGLAHSVLGAALEAKGLHEEAAEEYLTALVVGCHSPEECDAIRRGYQQRGILGLHEEDLNQCLGRWDGWHGLAFDISALQAGTGRIVDSLAWLERACDARSGRMAWLNSGTPSARIAQYFDNLRAEPRFLRILERVHLPI